MLILTWVGALAFLLQLPANKAELHRHHRQVSPGTQPGVCRYGRMLDCCYGWKRNSRGQCEARCEHGCKHGECVGPNKCKCYPGYTGKSCNQDLNECGLKPRPCQHRCMNTHGSYKCYCLNGYTLTPYGSCSNSRTCSLAHCQYGCEEVHGETRCLCPPAGLRLGPDNKTCVDIDECASGKTLCPFNRRCVNTFSSYYCKCRNGYDLEYINGKYDCADLNECLTGTHRCSQNAECLNSRGSYKCKCKPGFRGNGFHCSAIPDPPVKVTRILGGSKLDREQFKNVIPESGVTAGPRLRQHAFDTKGGAQTEDPGAQGARDILSEQEGEQEEEGQQKLENRIQSKEPSPRGDVFNPEEFESPATEVKAIPITPGLEDFIMDCSFHQGACEWSQDKEDDFDWNVVYYNNGLEYYMAVSGLLGDSGDLARLKLLLSDRVQQGSFCLTFSYRLKGEEVGTLRALLDDTRYPLWEQSQSLNQDWQTELVTVVWEEKPPHMIIFEVERGSGVGGEIGLDHTVIASGPCRANDPVVL
ncbi:epidermal growth factor-like protein 6 [Scleropages formosus]|uniref:EGF-like-domain, multiple 6 n=1 Tax=Scleropages formosus TaxID=113540 RepID=A0A8C9QNT1_SCLFO|nr:epidermal growth factor-like protein 6 [Scleropages formosus]